MQSFAKAAAFTCLMAASSLAFACGGDKTSWSGDAPAKCSKHAHACNNKKKAGKVEAHKKAPAKPTVAENSSAKG